MGAAGILKELHGELPVCVKLIFQPAEEDGGGAGRLVAPACSMAGSARPVRAIFGLHGWPGLPVGYVATKAGAAPGGNRCFQGHHSRQRLSRRVIRISASIQSSAACEVVVNLQQIVSRDLDPTEPAVVTVGIIHGGTATNIIPDRAMIEGTVRTLSESCTQRW